MRQFVLLLAGLMTTISSWAQSGIAPVTVEFKVLYPQIQYVESFEQERNCSQDSLQTVLNTKQQEILKLCPHEYRSCLFNGGCAVETSAGRIYINYIKYNEDKTKALFHVVDTSKCPAGLGISDICTDPYFTITTPPDHFKAGDVIEVPVVRGVVLPTGEIHDGFFIVRDRDSGLEDSIHGRLTFPIGPTNDYKSDVFVKLGLNNLESLLVFRQVDEARAALIRAKRNYPGVPAQGGL